jgi:hypothetical protein
MIDWTIFTGIVHPSGANKESLSRNKDIMAKLGPPKRTVGAEDRN